MEYEKELRLTFDESAKREILSFLDKTIDSDGFIVENQPEFKRNFGFTVNL